MPEIPPLLVYPFLIATLTNCTNLVTLKKPTYLLCYSSEGQKSDLLALLLKTLKENCLRAFSSFQKTLALIACSPFLHHLCQEHNVLKSLSDKLLLSTSTSKDTCDYTGPTEIVQGNLILKSDD